MKNLNIKFIIYSLVLCSIAVASCKKQLDQAPISEISPENFFNEESQLGAYTIARYPEFLPSHQQWSYGTFGSDANTDNMATPDLSVRYIPGQWRVGTSGGDWDFGNIRQCNYFLEQVLPRLNNNQILGDKGNINHYIGEMYFLRAYEYFNKLQSLGDFPIIRRSLPDEQAALVSSSERRPRTEVARFIISDLDSAIMLMKSGPQGNKNRLSKECAQLLKSRVGLFEGTWLKYFKGTAFVPNGSGWPGKSKSYNASYQFPSGSIDGEIEFFLKQSMDAGKTVADAVALVPNTGIIEAPTNENPYLNMFGAVNMSSYSEVLLWRQYSQAVITHNVPIYAQTNNNAVGVTRGLTESFLMQNGLPIYAAGSGYKGDDRIADVRNGRDGRLVLFLKEPGQKNLLFNFGQGTHETRIEPIPQIFETGVERRYTTGYTLRKGINYDAAQARNGQGYTGSIIFRASEAYLNYIEASYELTGAIDGTASTYWQKLRNRAGVDADYQRTIGATNMSKEVLDWGAYSAGSLISPILYNIRRERRNELMAEGLRLMDLKRWRAMDQMISTPYHFEGFKLWGPMKDLYTANQLVFGASNSNAIVSDPSLSVYLRPQEIRGNALSYQGAKFNMAHYLNPIAMQHFNISSSGGNFDTSPIYQNPGWPTQGGGVPN